MNYSDSSTPTTAKEPVYTVHDWFMFNQMTPDRQIVWMDEQWERVAAAQGTRHGDAWPVVPFDPAHDHRVGCCDPDQGCVDDSFSALIAATSSPIEPEPDDDQPEPWEIVENDGPCLVTICHDFSSDAEHGPDGRVECVDVVATVNRPQWSEVA